jgi:hypothetical protein
MSPISTFGSSLKVETNLGGIMKDNDEVQAEIKHREHDKQVSANPWSQAYGGSDTTYQEPTAAPVEDNPQLREAVNQDLNKRNLLIRNDHRN